MSFSEAVPHTLFTSPWRGEVGERSEPGGGGLRCATYSPHPDMLRMSTLPLQGRVGALPAAKGVAS